MNTILVTGGAGFIGSHVAARLQQAGNEVIIIDDFNDRYDPRLKKARLAHFFPAEEVRIYPIDIRDRAALTTVFTQHTFTTVIHLAAWASVLPSMSNPHVYTEVNVSGTVNVLELARHYSVEHFVFASSSSVYGGHTTMPLHEDLDVSRPVSPYAATKAAGEILCATWHNMYGLPATCLRFFTVYGPWGRPEMALFKFADAILHDRPVEMRGRQTARDFTFITDIVAGILAAIAHPNGFQIYNLGNHDAVPLPRLIAALEVALQKKAVVREVPLPPGDLPYTLADISRAAQALGFNPQTSIEAGVKIFGDWYTTWYLPNFSPAAVRQTPAPQPIPT